MQKKLTIILLILFSLLTSNSCFRTYPSYEQVVETRSKIEPISFTREKWFDDKGIGVEALWDTRPGLARDLVNRNLLIGKSYDEVQKLLGETEKLDNSISYSTCYEMGFADPIFVEDLYIEFNNQDEVESNEIRIKMMRGHPDYR